MSKRSKHGRKFRGPVDRSATTDIVTQLEVAFRTPHAAAIGALIGGLVPWFGRTLAHGEIQGTWSSNRPLALAMVAVVLGCGAFSGLSVYKFGRAAFGDPRKALGFVLALEGVMLVSHGMTSAVALMEHAERNRRLDIRGRSAAGEAITSVERWQTVGNSWVLPNRRGGKLTENTTCNGVGGSNEKTPAPVTPVKNPINDSTSTQGQIP